MKNLKFIFLLLLFVSSNSLALESEVNQLYEDQKKQLNAIEAQMRKDYSELVDNFTETSVEDIAAECLDNVMGIDLSVVTFDPSSLWASLYKQLRDEILEFTCSGIEEELNKHTAKLQKSLELPYGLGSLTLKQGGAVQDYDDLFEGSGKMSNEEALKAINKDLYGDESGFKPTYKTYEAKELTDAMNEIESRPKKVNLNTTQMNEKFKSGVINIKALMKSKKESENESNN